VSLFTHPDINLFIIALTEYQNTIYVKSRSVTSAATGTKKRNHVVEVLVEDLIKKYERGESSRFEFVSKVSYRCRK
jgi:hypothetical protein